MSERYLPCYHDSNTRLYLYHTQVRESEIKWKTCNAKENFHILPWQPGLGAPEPDPSKCSRCEVENGCKCDGTDLLRYGCRCGGK